jgi:hypothetical protein
LYFIINNRDFDQFRKDVGTFNGQGKGKAGFQLSVSQLLAAFKILTV